MTPLDSFAAQAAHGILYAEDFDEDRRPTPPVAPPSPVAAPRVPTPRPITQADIDQACIRAVQAAEQAWSAGAAERRTEALEAVAAGLATATEAAQAQANQVAEEVARTLLGLLAGALPALCRTHGGAEVRALAAQVLPLLGTTTRLVIRVHPSLVDALASDIAALDERVGAGIELRPANLPEGDVRLAWDQGECVRDSRAICAALHDALARLGLDAPIHQPTPIGSFALAD